MDYYTNKMRIVEWVLKVLMFSFFVGFIFLLAGCEEDARRARYREEYESKEREKRLCTCDTDKWPSPDPYVATLAFTDHQGKEQRFSVTVQLYRREQPPDVLYHTIGFRTDGKEYHYYSLEEPTKEKTGFTNLKEISGATVSIDFTQMEYRLIPLKLLPLDEASKKRIEYAAKYENRHKECPVHKDYRVSYEDGRRCYHSPRYEE